MYARYTVTLHSRFLYFENKKLNPSKQEFLLGTFDLSLRRSNRILLTNLRIVWQKTITGSR